MADGIGAFLIWAAAVLPSGALAQPMDYATRQQFEVTVAQMSKPAAQGTLADQARAVMSGLGLTSDIAAPGWKDDLPSPAAPPPAFVPDGSAVVELVDIRLLLTQIAIQSGARNHIALVRAQGPRDHGVILLRSGLVTLDDLFDLVQGTPAQAFVTQSNAGVVLTRPLAIWADAGLTLGDAEKLILVRPSGSFVVNLGWLDMRGGSIVGAGGPNATEAGFRPFVLTAGRGSFTARAAKFRALGFGDAAVFGGIAVVNTGLVAPQHASSVTNSTLVDVRSLALLGTTGATVSGNHISGSDGTAILLSQVLDSVVHENRLDALSGPQAIRVTAAASGVTISGNLVSGSPRTGILVDRGSRYVQVTGNVVQGSLTTGIGTNNATCVAITANLVATNGGVGVNLSDTDAATISANALLFNHGSGLLLRNQTAAAVVHVAGNVFVGNDDGLRGATPGKLSLQVNNFDGQTPRVFAGDFAPLTVPWLRSRRDATPFVMAAAPSSTACADSGAN